MLVSKDGELVADVGSYVVKGSIYKTRGWKPLCCTKVGGDWWVCYSTKDYKSLLYKNGVETVVDGIVLKMWDNGGLEFLVNGDLYNGFLLKARGVAGIFSGYLEEGVVDKDGGYSLMYNGEIRFNGQVYIPKPKTFSRLHSCLLVKEGGVILTSDQSGYVNVWKNKVYVESLLVGNVASSLYPNGVVVDGKKTSLYTL